MDARSGCPINLATEVLGDGWSMVLLRDVIFGNRRTFRTILESSMEGIATNILAARLKSLVAQGLLTAAPDPKHKQRTIYSLTEKSIALVPALVTLGAWARSFLPISQKLSVPNRVLAEGGLEFQEEFMDELRERHLGQPYLHQGTRPSALMSEAYEAALAEFAEADLRGNAEKR